LGGIAQTGRDYARERAMRRAVTSAFRHYLAPALVDRLARDPAALRLGGERRNVTVLFCDLRDFTALSETMKDDPEALTALVNRALTPIADAVLASGGAIDKFIGDCVMGVWNAPLDTPDHARRALVASVGIVHEIERLGSRIADERISAGMAPIRISCGIGINTGECVVGNMGTATRFDYTAIGDAVNLAARLEGRTKHYGLPVLVGEDTAREAGFEGLLRIDRVSVKGRAAPVDLYAPLALFARGDDADRAASLQSSALDAYRRGAWDEARAEWARLAALAPETTIYSALMSARAARFAEAPPPPAWAGEWRFDEK
jgi:adenylate cyclase